MKKGAFDYHPHRGIETVTYMIDGELQRMDNRGNKGELKKRRHAMDECRQGIVAPGRGTGKRLCSPASVMG